MYSAAFSISVLITRYTVYHGSCEYNDKTPVRARNVQFSLDRDRLVNTSYSIQTPPAQQRRPLAPSILALLFPCPRRSPSTTLNPCLSVFPWRLQSCRRQGQRESHNS